MYSIYLKTENEFNVDQAEQVSDRLAMLSFFPHLSVFKAACCGIARKLCQKNQQLAFTVLMYLETLVNQQQFFVQYS